MARRLDEGTFEIDEHSTLHGCPVHGMQIPRALDESGQQRYDLFAFSVNAESLSEFHEGQIVILNAKAPRSSDPER